MMIEDPIPELKQRLANLILQEIGDAHWGTVGRILGLDQTRASRLTQGRLERFSVQWLIRRLARINRKVEVSIVVVGPLPTRWHKRVWEAQKDAALVVKRDERVRRM